MIATRETVERILSSIGVFNPRHEIIRDLGILVGGTEDQSLHHDIPRQTAGWRARDGLPREDDMDGEDDQDAELITPGWEINRLAYNEVMTGPFPPRSVLFGLGNDDTVRLGIQKNQIILVG
jgi:hypothetical protein